MNKSAVIGAIGLMVAAAGAAYWYFVLLQTPVATPQSAAPAAAAPAVVAPPPPLAPGVKNPLPAPPVPAPLPALEASDAFVAEVLAGVFGSPAFREFFAVDSLIRRIVISVDNVPRSRIPRMLLPVKPPGGQFRITEQNGQPVVAADNAARYERHVKLAESVELSKVVAAYRSLYPLFQSAYGELGYPDAYFNDRLVEVIDHLLGTPPATEPLQLVRPKVFYEFADPGFESLSAGRKLMLRIGNANSARIKARLRELRAMIATAPEAPRP